MASFRFTFENGTEGIDYTVDVICPGPTTTGSVITSTQVQSIIFDPGGQNITFTPGLNDSPGVGAVGLVYYEFQELSPPISPLVNPPDYFNWRSVNTVSSHPISGRSFDVWLADPATMTSISQGSSWSLLTNGTGVHSLNSQKWSVFYDYNVPCAYGWIRGGQVTVTVI